MTAVVLGCILVWLIGTAVKAAFLSRSSDLRRKDLVSQMTGIHQVDLDRVTRSIEELERHLANRQSARPVSFGLPGGTGVPEQAASATAQLQLNTNHFGATGVFETGPSSPVRIFGRVGWEINPVSLPEDLAQLEPAEAPLPTPVFVEPDPAAIRTALRLAGRRELDFDEAGTSTAAPTAQRRDLDLVQPPSDDEGQS